MHTRTRAHTHAEGGGAARRNLNAKAPGNGNFRRAARMSGAHLTPHRYACQKSPANDKGAL